MSIDENRERGPGRPPLADETTTIRLRVPVDLAELLKEAAGGEGQFSAWARRHLERIAKREIKARRERGG